MSASIKPTMLSTTLKENARLSLQDEQLRKNLRKAMDGFIAKRAASLSDAQEREALRILGQNIKARAMAKLPELLELLEENLTKKGIKVHWAQSPDEANEIFYSIVKKHESDFVVKGKSMVSEEIEMNHYLEDRGIKAIETDMGEYIVQLAGEKPSHIVVPAVHKNRFQIAKLFQETLGTEYTEDVDELIQIGRRTLREKFANAHIGLSGVNFAVAQTGTLVLIENEGNGRMSTTVPPVHVAITGIEKVVENLEDVAPLISLLTRSSLGQAITTYVNMISSPRQDDELDGPKEVHLILLDNGRTQAFADAQCREALYCIRCAACLNHCPVYVRIGGQAYGTVYPGPIGAIIAPHMVGLENTPFHPFASTLCGACNDVCPVKIPITEELRRLRQESVKDPNTSPIYMKGQGVNHSSIEKMVWKGWQAFYTKPKLGNTLSTIATRMRWVVPSKLGAWTKNHTAPKLAPKTLHELAREYLGE